MQKQRIACETCGKKYIKQCSLEKHKILCDFLVKTKREKQIQFEEDADLPTYIQLIAIVQELSMKYSRLEDKMIGMQKWVEQKKKKMNVIEWLNTMIPSSKFTDWVKQIRVEEDHFQFLMEHNIVQTIQVILEENISNNVVSDQDQPDKIDKIDKINKRMYPIQCFSQKTNLFYVCDDIENCIWRQMTFEDFVYLLKDIQNKLLISLSQWRIANKNEINENDSISILYNRTIIKLMNISFSKDAVYSKIRSNLYHYLKGDIRNKIEYEFEF